MALQSEFPSPGLIGSFRSFGAVGPAYQVLKPVRQLDDGDWLLNVQILESGEQVSYRYTAVLDDPKAL
jgi:hypothetical protein